MARTNAAAKVGTVMILALMTLLALGYFFVGRTMGGYVVDVEFGDAQGITEQADVLMSGVKVGSVRSVRLNERNRPVLRLVIRPEYRIPVGSSFTISSGGLLGELEVMITPPEHALATLPTDTQTPPLVRGKDLVTIDDLKEQLAALGQDTRAVMKNLQDVTRNVAELSGDPILHSTLRASAVNAQRMSEQGVRAVGDVRATVADVRAALGQITGSLQREIPTLQATLRNMERTSRQGQPIAEEAHAALAEVRGLMADLRETNAFLKGALEDTLKEAQAGPALKQTMENLTLASQQLTVIAANARRISEDLAGTDQTTTRVGNVVDDVAKLAGKANELLEKITGVTERAGRPRGRLINARGQVDAYQRLGDDARFRADANLAVALSADSTVLLGLTDIGEGNRLNLQYSTPFTSRTRLRYGFITGKLGVGLDWNIYGNPATPWVANPPGARSVSFNFSDPNSARLDLYARHQFNSQIGLVAGFEDVFDHAHPVVGLTYRP